MAKPREEWEKPWCPRCRLTVLRVRASGLCGSCDDEKQLNDKGYGVFTLGSAGRIIP